MYAQSILPSFSFPQDFLKADDSNHRQERKNHIDDDHSRSRPRPVADSYHPSKLGEIANSNDISSRMAVQSLSTNTNKSAEIQVTTQEGDVVTISLNQSASNSRASLYAEQGDNKIAAYAETSSYSSSFSLSIEGDLNKEEQESLAKLMDKMSKVSDKFFKGNINAAFKHAKKIGFDAEQISNFSMSLNQEKSIQAVSAYQQTIMPEQNINTDLLKQASNFLTETKEFMTDTQAALDSMIDPKQFFADLFAGIGQMHFAEQPVEKEADEPLFLKVIENIGDDLFDEEDE